jgi:predicted Fe-Mo cluster-binding NifX family protein
MRIAIPVVDGKLFGHFGHCPAFALINANENTGEIIARNDVAAPRHEPGLLPAWLGERGVNLVITGGMGPKAQDLFAQRGIKVVVGAPEETPEALVSAYFAGTLQTSANRCDH